MFIYRTIILILFLLSSKVYSEEIIKFYRPLSTRYLVYRSSLTIDDLRNFKSVLVDKSKNHWQPSARYRSIFNSQFKFCGESNYTETDIKIDSTTTRIVIDVDSNVEKEQWVKNLLNQGKAIKLSELWEKQYDDTRIGGRNLYTVETKIYREYHLDETNKDFCLYEVKESTQ